MFVKSLLNKLTGAKPSESGEPRYPFASQLRTLLAPLDQVEPGLARRTAAYVATGDDRPVLATLSAKSPACNQAFAKHHKGVNEITRLIRVGSKHLPATARLTEVCSRALSDRVRGYYGQRTDLDADLITLTTVAGAPKYGVPDNSTDILKLADLIAITGLLHLEVSDLIMALYGQRYSQLHRAYVKNPQDTFPILFADVATLRNSFQKLEAWSREDLLNHWHKSNYRPDDYLPLLIDLAGDGSTKVREAARKMLADQPADQVTALALEHLDAGKAATRTAMVQILGDNGTDDAHAALKARLDKEKTQSVRMLIEQFLTLEDAPAENPDGKVIGTDGSILECPAFVPLTDNDDTPFGKEDLADLKAAEEKNYQAQLESQRLAKEKGYKGHSVYRLNNASQIMDLFNGKTDLNTRDDFRFNNAVYHNWMSQALDRLPPAHALRLALKTCYSLEGALGPYAWGSGAKWIGDALAKGSIEMRHVLAAADEIGKKIGGGYNQPDPQGADASEKYLNKQFSVSAWDRSYQHVPPYALAPLVMENLSMVADALPPKATTSGPNEVALRMLETLSALPKSFVQPVLFAAIGEAKAPREIARRLLQDVDGIDDVLIEVLTDRRQAIRSNCASFLAQRGTTAALPALAKRLKTEKSDFTRAAMISAVADLGGKTDPYLGKKPLSDEAEKHVAKLKADKIDWLKPDQAPKLMWKDGKPCPDHLADGWLRLALKLKAPAETALWSLYLDQLNADSARAFSDWVLTSWIAYDSYQTPRDELYQAALKNAKQMKAQYANSPYYSKLTAEQIAAQNMSYMTAHYPNSGSDSKGILALAIRATPNAMAQQCSAYLKAHGKRPAQAKAILDMLAGADTPESLQVIVATATRFKQRSVREHAEQLVALVAEKRGWSADELADRSIPTGGFEDGGQLDLPVGEDAKPYAARLDSDLKIQVFNPEGRTIKSLPAGKDELTKESKALLSAARKTVKTVTTQQAARLHEAMMSERSWNAKDWQADLATHPIMTRLTERVVWRALNDKGDTLLTFRPTAEGDLLDAEGEDITLDQATRIDVAHGSHMDADTLAAWKQHLDDFEITPLFIQLGRPVLTLNADQKKQDKLEDRKGWVMEALRLKSLAEKYGYQAGPNEDGGWFFTFNKIFTSAGITAQIEFTGTGPYAEAHDCAITGLSFQQSGKVAAWSRGSMNLKDVPALLLSECWNDVHEIATKGAFDADWEKKSYY